jgi:hypothetical protein
LTFLLFYKNKKIKIKGYIKYKFYGLLGEGVIVGVTDGVGVILTQLLLTQLSPI